MLFLSTPDIPADTCPPVSSPTGEGDRYDFPPLRVVEIKLRPVMAFLLTNPVDEGKSGKVLLRGNFFRCPTISPGYFRVA
jgi:hypothetical protein